jgi:hypothetical protein
MNKKAVIVLMIVLLLSSISSIAIMGVPCGKINSVSSLEYPGQNVPISSISAFFTGLFDLPCYIRTTGNQPSPLTCNRAVRGVPINPSTTISLLRFHDQLLHPINIAFSDDLVSCSPHGFFLLI